ncbi:MAG: YidC/Oxa1 family membrane protein insertase [Erysipelotrichaceae bacterium]
MKKILKNRKFWLVALAIMGVLLLSGCRTAIDKNGALVEDAIIYDHTSFSDMLETDGWFETFIVYPIAQLINYSGKYIGPVGGIVLATALINLLTITLTKNSTVAQQKMQALQPEMRALQNKYAGKNDQNSKMQMNREMMALYQKHGISNPLGSMAGPFLQMPIMIAVYYAVQRADVVLSAELFGTPMMTSPMKAIAEGQFMFMAILAIAIGLQFLSMMLPQLLAKKNQRRRPGQPKTPNMMGMNIGMSAMFAFIGINWPVSMSLYWLISATMNILKTIFIRRRHIDNV